MSITVSYICELQFTTRSAAWQCPTLVIVRLYQLCTFSNLILHICGLAFGCGYVNCTSFVASEKPKSTIAVASGKFVVISTSGFRLGCSKYLEFYLDFIVYLEF
jgi:hypothetical protein